MNSPGEPRPRSAFRIIFLLIFFSILGNFIAGVVCYFQPKIYESSGIFAESAAPLQTTPLAGAHAATIVSELSLHLRWGVPFEDAVAHLKKIVSIETSAEGSIIRARSTSAADARFIADAVMRAYPGFERERQWAQTAGLDHRYTEKEIETQREVDQLRKVILETIEDSGARVPGSLITAETVARLGNKDLTRQYDAYLKAARPIGRFAPPDGSIAVPPPIVIRPTESQGAISPEIDTYFLVGRTAGLTAAIGILLAIIKYRPSLLEVPIPKPPSSPAWAEAQNDPGRDHPTW